MSVQNNMEAPAPATDPAVATVSPARGAAPAPATATAPAPMPSIHIRAVITWLAIFPLVALGMLTLGPAMESWHPVLRALLLTAIVVPLAVYVVVPRMFAIYGKLLRRRAR